MLPHVSWAVLALSPPGTPDVRYRSLLMLRARSVGNLYVDANHGFAGVLADQQCFDS